MLAWTSELTIDPATLSRMASGSRLITGAWLRPCPCPLLALAGHLCTDLLDARGGVDDAHGRRDVDPDESVAARGIGVERRLTGTAIGSVSMGIALGSW